MKTDEELKAEFLAKRGATRCNPYDARPARNYPVGQIMAAANVAIRDMSAASRKFSRMTREDFVFDKVKALPCES